MKQKYDVVGMTCSACSAHVDKAVRHLDGVHDVNVNLLSNCMVVDYDENKVCLLYTSIYLSDVSSYFRK